MFICNIDDIPDTKASAELTLNNTLDELANCFETEINIDNQQTPVFLLKHDGSVKAYINACPHTGAKLNWQPGVFLDSDKHYIQCTIHGALFEKETGLCVHGPCVRQHLNRLDIVVKDEKVYLNR